MYAEKEIENEERWGKRCFLVSLCSTNGTVQLFVFDYKKSFNAFLTRFNTQSLINNFNLFFAGELIVVSLGALTNIALAVRIDPGFIGRLSHLYIAAGNIYSKLYFENISYNVYWSIDR